MYESSDVFLNDGREIDNCESRYSKENKKQIKKEATYLICLFIFSLFFIISNYKSLWTNVLNVPIEDVDIIKKVVYCLSAGVLGGVTFGMKMFYRAVARGYWNWDRVYWRVLSPIISLSITVVVSAFMADTILKPQVHWAISIGFFAGYFSENAVGKMCDIAEILFSTKPVEKAGKKNDETSKNG